MKARQPVKSQKRSTLPASGYPRSESAKQSVKPNNTFAAILTAIGLASQGGGAIGWFVDNTFNPATPILIGTVIVIVASYLWRR